MPAGFSPVSCRLMKRNSGKLAAPPIPFSHASHLSPAVRPALEHGVHRRQVRHAPCRAADLSAAALRRRDRADGRGGDDLARALAA